MAGIGERLFLGRRSLGDGCQQRSIETRGFSARIHPESRIEHRATAEIQKLEIRMNIESIVKRINLSKLSRREKIIVAAGGCLLALFLLIQLVIAPVFSRTAQMRRAVQSKTLILADMRSLKSEYDGLKSRAKQSEARYTRRDKGFTLFSFLDQLAGQSGIKERVNYMRPSKIEQKNSALKLSRWK
jgi:hypothetical protein